MMLHVDSLTSRPRSRSVDADAGVSRSQASKGARHEPDLRIFAHICEIVKSSSCSSLRVNPQNVCFEVKGAPAPLCMRDQPPLMDPSVERSLWAFYRCC